MKSSLKSLSTGLIAAALFSITAVSAVAAPIGDATYLRKLSLAIRGVPPSSAEFTELAKTAHTADRKAFFDKKISEYLNSQEHADRMVYRVSETLQIKPPAAPKRYVDKYPSSGHGTQVHSAIRTEVQDSVRDIVMRIASKNLSWDTLLTTKEYTVFPRSEYDFVAGASDIGFFQRLSPQAGSDSRGGGAVSPDYLKVTAAQAPISLSFQQDDLRVSGVLTTSRFANRYTTTGINKNRKRAAAVFRTFLCDPMIPAIASSGDRTHEFIDATFAEKFVVTENEIRNGALVSAEARHGSDAQCMSCHYKLDPLGKVFQNTGVVLGSKPSPGALIFKRSSDGTLVDVPVRGIGELGTAITKQPEYVDCQVQWFWREFIGQDVPLPSQKKQQWVQKFESVGRRTNDFISALVRADEFRNPPVKSQFVTFDRVQPLLKRCDNCHSKQDDIPTMAKLPIGLSGAADEHATWIAEMSERMNRPDGARGKMPKDPGVWAQEDIELVKTWLAQGARDENGNPTVPTGGTP